MIAVTMLLIHPAESSFFLVFCFASSQYIHTYIQNDDHGLILSHCGGSRLMPCISSRFLILPVERADLICLVGEGFPGLMRDLHQQQDMDMPSLLRRHVFLLSSFDNSPLNVKLLAIVENIKKQIFSCRSNYYMKNKTSRPSVEETPAGGATAPFTSLAEEKQHLATCIHKDPTPQTSEPIGLPLR